MSSLQASFRVETTPDTFERFLQHEVNAAGVGFWSCNPNLAIFGGPDISCNRVGFPAIALSITRLGPTSIYVTAAGHPDTTPEEFELWLSVVRRAWPEASVPTREDELLAACVSEESLPASLEGDDRKMVEGVRQGLSDAEIGAELHLSPKRIANRLSELRGKYTYRVVPYRNRSHHANRE